MISCGDAADRTSTTSSPMSLSLTKTNSGSNCDATPFTKTHSFNNNTISTVTTTTTPGKKKSKRTRKQLNVPLKELKQLSEEQICKLISMQSKHINLTSWELESLLSICREKGCVDKGFAVLFQYAGNLDRVNQLLERRKQYSHALRGFLSHVINSNCNNSSNSNSNSNSNDTADNYNNTRTATTSSGLYFELFTEKDISTFVDLMSTLAMTTAKLVYTVASLRKLQWSPRPIICRSQSQSKTATSIDSTCSNTNTGTGSITSNAVDTSVIGGEEITLQELLRIEADELLETVTQSGILSILNRIPRGQLIVLMSPLLDITDLQERVLQHLVTELQQEDDLIAVSNNNLTDQQYQLYEIFRQVFLIEDQIEATYMSYRSIADLDDPYDSYPILRLPYRGIDPSLEEDLSWFSEKAPYYKFVCEIIGMELKEGCLANVPVSVEGGTRDPFLMTSSSSSSLSLSPTREFNNDNDESMFLFEETSVSEFTLFENDMLSVLSDPPTTLPFMNPSSAPNTKNNSQSKESTNTNQKSSQKNISKANSSLVSTTSTKINKKTVTPKTSSKSSKSTKSTSLSPSSSPPSSSSSSSSSSPQPISTAEKSKLKQLSLIDPQDIFENDNSFDSAMVTKDLDNDEIIVPNDFDFGERGVEGGGSINSSINGLNEIKDDASLNSSNATITTPQLRQKKSVSITIEKNKEKTSNNNNSSIKSAKSVSEKRVNTTEGVSRVKSVSPSPSVRPSTTSTSISTSSSRSLNVSSSERKLSIDSGDERRFSPSRSSPKSSRKSVRGPSPLTHSNSNLSTESWESYSPSSVYNHSTVPIRFGTPKKRAYTTSNDVAEWAALKKALKMAQKKGGTKKEIAVRKIRMFWKVLGPRKKFLRHMQAREFIIDMVYELGDIVVSKCNSRIRRRKKWIRERAATKIQQVFRYWLENSLVNIRKEEKVRRKKDLDSNIKFLAIAVLAAIRVWQFMKRYYLRKKKLNPYRRPVYIHAVISQFWEAYKQYNLNRSDVGPGVSLLKSRKTVRRFKIIKATDRAAIIIQKFIRCALARIRVKDRKKWKFMEGRILKFMARTNIRSRVNLKRTTNRAALIIQRVYRGYKHRNYLFRRFKSGIIIYNMFNRIRSFKSLKSSLRRVEKPIKISVRGLRNIAYQHTRSNSMKFKLSVWWHPLLHIVSESDFETIINSKQPQLIYNSLPCTPTVNVSPALISFNNSDKTKKSMNDREEDRDDDLSSDSDDEKTLPVKKIPSVNTTSTLLSLNNRKPPADQAKVSNGMSKSPTSLLPASPKKTSPLSADYNPLPALPIGDKLPPLVRSKSSFAFPLTLSSSLSFKGLGSLMNFGTSYTSSEINADKKYFCPFEQDVIRIPGCHGNAVFRFDFFDGERKFGSCTFNLGKEGQLMFWKGSFSREVGTLASRRAVQYNSRTIVKAERAKFNFGDKENPIFDFEVEAGPPMRSRCQWARVKMGGSGPAKRAMQGNGIIGAMLERWFKFFISVDAFGIHFFENKSTHETVFTSKVKDLKNMRIEQGQSTRFGGNKFVAEDNCNVILFTKNNDVIFLRFQDAGSRIFWVEVFDNIIDMNEEMMSSNHAIANNTSIIDMAQKFAGKLTKKDADDAPKVNNDDTDSDEENNTVSGMPMPLRRRRFTHLKK